MNKELSHSDLVLPASFSVSIINADYIESIVRLNLQTIKLLTKDILLREEFDLELIIIFNLHFLMDVEDRHLAEGEKHIVFMLRWVKKLPIRIFN